MEFSYCCRQACSGLGKLKAGWGSGGAKGLARLGRVSGEGPGPGDCGGRCWRAEPARFLPPLGLNAGTQARRLGSHDALLLKWHLLPLSCLFWLSGSCHVRRAAPALCRLSPHPSPLTLRMEGPTRAVRLGRGLGPPGHWGRGGPCAQLQANQFGN